MMNVSTISTSADQRAAHMKVCGPRVQKGAPCGIVLRVTSRGQRSTFKLDRWD